VRPALARFRLVGLTAEAIALGAPAALANGTTPFDLAILQLPTATNPGPRWVARAFLPGQRPGSGILSIAARRALDLSAPSGEIAGLLIDEWTEFLPSDAQRTAYAVHYDNPGAEAPQVALLAVAPVLGGSWEIGTVASIVSETIDLAQIRAVDADTLGQSLLAPTIYCAANLDNATVSDDFGTLVMAEDEVLPPEGSDA
jgi:hypothetical protein